MTEDDELKDEPSSWEEEAGQESQPTRPYDPLTEPWDDPASASLADYLSQMRETDAGRNPSAPLGRPSPYVDELSDLRRRLREETTVVPRRRRMWAVTARELAETLVLAVLIFLAVRASMQNFRVEGASMQPSLDNGEYLVVNKLAYSQIDLSLFDWMPFFDAGEDPVHHLWSSPGRGDVIVFRAPTNVDRDFIKRIIGVPGDVVEIERDTGDVMLNGRVIQEPYISGKTTCGRSCGPWTVPNDAYFVMGDNRPNSSDSRQGWFVPEENIIGKALITYWHDGGPDVDLAPNHKVSITTPASAEE